MQAVENLPRRVVLAVPGSENAEGEVRIVAHILNGDEAELTDLVCTGVTLGGIPRTSLAPDLPKVIGTVPPYSAASVGASFPASRFIAGSRYLLTVRAAYTFASATYGVTLNRYVVIPPPTAPVLEMLKANVSASVSADHWNYALHNDESPSSGLFIATFSLEVAAPVTVTGTPPGWMAETDNISYVHWKATDLEPPYPNHIAPGTSLGGFQLTSPRTRSEGSPALLIAWNHDLDAAGRLSQHEVPTPFRFD